MSKKMWADRQNVPSRKEQSMGKLSKAGKIILRIALVISALIYPGFMAMMSAAGWMHNVGTGSYPDVFRSFAGWMYAGGGMLCAGTVLVLLGAKPKLWICNLIGMAAGVIGCGACLSSLYRFCAYADQHFSGIGETMQPVSELYRGRLLPVILTAVLLVILGAWQSFSEDAREYRIARKREKEARENAPAPKILGE